MRIDPKDLNKLAAYRLMTSLIVPRPIAWVGTRSVEGVDNLAPFSYFNGVCSKPPTIMFAPARRGWDGNEKDTLVNIRESKEFTIVIIRNFKNVFHLTRAIIVATIVVIFKFYN